MPRDPDRAPGRRWYAAPEPERFAAAGYPHRCGVNQTLPRRRILDAAAAGIALADIPAVARVPGDYLDESLADLRFAAKYAAAVAIAAARGFDAQPHDQRVSRMRRYNRLRRGQAPREPRDGDAQILDESDLIRGGRAGVLDMQLTVMGE